MSAPDPFAGVFAGGTCRLCGCTDDNACPPTCSWVEEDLCSTCAVENVAEISASLGFHMDPWQKRVLESTVRPVSPLAIALPVQDRKR